MTMIYDKNEEKVVISVDKLSKICWKNNLKKSFKVLFLSFQWSLLESSPPKEMNTFKKCLMS
jgi:hypothetical protein